MHAGSVSNSNLFSLDEEELMMLGDGSLGEGVLATGRKLTAGGNLNPKIVSKKTNTIIGKNQIAFLSQ